MTIRAGDVVAVFGCGGVGLNVLQGARLAGAERIVAIDTNPAKLALATRFGAMDTIDAAAMDPVEVLKELTAGVGVDVSFEVIGLAGNDPAGAALGPSRWSDGARRHARPRGDKSRCGRWRSCMAPDRSGVLYGSSLPQVEVPRILALHDDGELQLRALISGEIGLDDVTGVSSNSPRARPRAR